MIFGPERTFSVASSTSYCTISDGVNVWAAYASGGNVFVKKSTNQGYGLDTAVAVTVNSGGAAYETMLNDPFAYDPVTGDLHLFWEQGALGGGTASLWTSHSQDGGATWSAAVQVDTGSGYGTNVFYRVGAVAYNGVVGIIYTPETSGTYITNGNLKFSQSTDRGVTFSAPVTLFSTVGPHEPNAVLGDDGSMHSTWYDPGTNTNTGGDLYHARATWSAGGYTWPGSPTRVTTGQVCGRPRPAVSNGTVVIVANTNYGGSVADVATIRSTDAGATWGSIVTVATHTTGPLDHPAIELKGQRAVIVWTDQGMTVYGSAQSTDGGASWTVGQSPFTSTASSDAPMLRATNDLVLCFGAGGKWTVLPLFNPDPALTATNYFDQFNRADENPLSDSGKWATDVVNGPSGGARLVSNQVTRQAGGFARSGSYRNDRTAAANYEVFCDIVASGGEVDLLIADQATKNCYNLVTADSDFGVEVTLNRGDGGSGPSLGGNNTRGLTAGDKYVLRLLPNDVVVLRYRADKSGWEEVVRGRDATYRAGSLRPAFNIAGASGNPIIDNFGDTTLAVPSNTVLPVASGTIGVSNVLTCGLGTWATASGATPTKYSYQWQSSPVGANTWSNVSRATLAFHVVTDATKDYRCVVTAYNGVGSVSANSNTLSAATGPGLIYIVNPFTC